MKTFVLFLLVSCLISSGLGTPSMHPGNGIALRHKREAGNFDNNSKLIQEAVENLHSATQQAVSSMNNFAQGIQEQVGQFQQQVTRDIAALRERVNKAVEEIRSRFQLSGAAFITCVENHRVDADKLFNRTVAQTIACATDRIDDIGGNIANLTNATSEAIQHAEEAIRDSRNCTESNPTNILAAGACLGGVALRVQYQGATYALQSGIAISRIGIAISTLQQTLQACAASRFLEASLGVAKIALEIGSCSATSIFSILTQGNSN